MSRTNPFLLHQDPYRENPFAVLGVDADANNATIDAYARWREAAIDDRKQPVPGLELQTGDFTTAAKELQDPVLRLAFDLMHFGFPNPGDEA